MWWRPSVHWRCIVLVRPCRERGPLWCTTPLSSTKKISVFQQGSSKIKESLRWVYWKFLLAREKDCISRADMSDHRVTFDSVR